jgi:hypothetical protein
VSFRSNAELCDSSIAAIACSYPVGGMAVLLLFAFSS